MPKRSAISRSLSVVIILVVIAAAFAGYALGLNQSTQVLTTTLSAVTTTTTKSVQTSACLVSSCSNTTTAYGGTCFQSAESQIFLTVLNDSSAAKIAGVEATGNVKWLCGSTSPPGYFIASQDIGPLYTPSNGTILVGSIIGNYSLMLQYLGHSYRAEFGVGAEQNVYVNISLPSTRISEVGCTFFGNTCFNETSSSMTLTTITSTAT